MNILIIDDEPFIANTVFFQLMELNRENDCYDIAFSAAQARECMKEKRYDIFVCDIVMPDEDGICFAKWVLKNYPERKIIFLTAHADYEYMKQAISIQSFDYILQPAEKEELKDAVERAKKQIFLEKKNSELISTGTFFQDKEMELLDSNALCYLAGESNNQDYLRRILNKRKIQADQQTVFLLNRVQVVQMMHTFAEWDLNLLRSMYYNIIDEMMDTLNEQYSILLSEEQRGDFWILSAFSTEKVPDISLVEKQLEELRVMFEKLITTKTAIYMGNYCLFDGLCAMYQKLKYASENNVQNWSRVFFVERGRNAFSNYSFELQLSSWRNLLSQNRLTMFRNSVLNYLTQTAEINLIDQNFMMKFHQSVAALLFNYMSENNIKSSDVFNESLSYYDFLYSYRNVKTFQDMLWNIVECLGNHVDVQDETQVQNIIRYIRKNIEQDLTVGDIAEIAGLNQDYLGRLFKKSTGMGLKHFICNEKMKTAKMLLDTTELSVTEISAQVGYSNYSNFTRTFKQLSGYTPSEYRKRKES